MPSNKLKDFGLYFITDSSLTKKNIFDDVKSALECGIKVIQYREKNASTKKMMEEAMNIKKLCRKNNALFLVNDRIDVAIVVGADGVHLGENDMPYHYARKLLGQNKIIGLSAAKIKDAIISQEIGADYVGIGPIYKTNTKKDAGNPIGLGILKKAKKKLKVPYVAIGGINELNIDDVLGTGARNIAIISAILEKNDIKTAIKFFADKIKSYE